MILWHLENVLTLAVCMYFSVRKIRYDTIRYDRRY